MPENKIPKSPRSFEIIGTSVNGASVTFSKPLTDYTDVCFVIYAQVGSVQLTFTTGAIPGGMFTDGRNLRGAGGFGTELDCYQLQVSNTGLSVSGIYVNGTDRKSTSLVQVYAR